jgi:N-acetylneuraminic acid mutarotase
MIVWGGSGAGTFNTGARYDPIADVWTPTSTINPPSPRFFHSAVWTGSQMIVWGGTGSSLFNTGGRYDPVADAWTPTSTGGAPPPSTGHVAAWTGSLMLIYGGTGNSGGRYDPALDAWSGMSTLNAPFAARYSTAVWSGNVMIVWGGLTLNGIRYLNEGGRYDPVSDTWSTTSTSGAPSPRASHTAIWTGSRMIVWGGYVVFTTHTDLNSGGVYDPVSDAWTSVSFVGAPSARSLHAAVWTGQRMAVWGGFNTSVTHPTDGGLYDPITATWAPMSTTNAPAARAGLVGVWTGQEALFWGGDGLNTGGRYNPFTDTWTTMSPAPVGRDKPASVWTGREMIVLGGAQTLVGERYDPAIDHWMPMSVMNAPPAFQGMSSVWTGTFMIVWGGNSLYGESDSFNTGGRYCAACADGPFYFDRDGDGVGDSATMVASCHQVPGYVPVGGDCNDFDGASWGLPSEVTDLGLLDNVTLSWSPPAVSGGVGLSYDLLRSGSASDFVDATACVASDAETFQAVDPETPPLGGMFAYLVRAQNRCPGGEGSLGTDSNGVPRTGRPCP